MFAPSLATQAQKADRGKLKAELDKAGGASGKLELLKSKIDAKMGGSEKKSRRDGGDSKRAHKHGGSASAAAAALGLRDDSSSIAGDSCVDDDVSSVASTSLVASIAAQATSTEHEAGAPITQPVDLGPHFLREYLRFNRHGDGKLEMEQFIAVMEATLLRRNLKVFRKQLEGMFKAADFDEDGIVDLRQFVLLESVKKYFETLQRREIHQQQQANQMRDAEMRAAHAQQKAASTAARAAAQAQAAAQEAAHAVAAAGMLRLSPPSDPSCDNLNSSRWQGVPGSARRGMPGMAPQAQGQYDVPPMLLPQTPGGMPPGGMPPSGMHPGMMGAGGGGMMDPRSLDRLDNPLNEKLDRIEANLKLALEMGGSPDGPRGRDMSPPRGGGGSRGNSRSPGPPPGGKQSSVIYLDDWQRGGTGRSAAGMSRTGQQRLAIGHAPMEGEHVPGDDLTNRGAPASRRDKGKDKGKPLAGPFYDMQAGGPRSYMVRKDGRDDERVDASNARMHSFVSSQAASLTTKHVDPQAGLVGKIADSKATGWALKAMGFDLNSEAQTQPHVGAIGPAVRRPEPSTPAASQRGRGLERKDSFGKRAGGFLGGLMGGGGSQRGRRADSPSAQRANPFAAPSSPAPPTSGRAAQRSDSFMSKAKRAFGGGTPKQSTGGSGEVVQQL